MRKSKALFLDRDGVINVEKNYVYRIEDFEFMDGIFDVLRYFQEHGYLLIVITNQAGIGRGYYTEDDFNRLNEWMLQQLAENGIHITQVYYCPYHPEYGIGEYKRDSFDRKPNPGMILKACKEFDISPDGSILIGDKESDVVAGITAGIGRNILVSDKCEINTQAQYIFTTITSLKTIV